MDELKEIIFNLKLTEQKYNVLVGYIQEEAKDGYINATKLLNFVNILENKKDGNENE